MAHADDFLAQVKGLQSKALGILEEAERAGDLRTAVAAVREARGNLELPAKLLGLMTERHQVEVKPVVKFTIGVGYDQPSTAPSGANGVAALQRGDPL